MASESSFPSGARCHLVLVPGFGGFDALGQIEYYAGITGLFQRWKARHPSPPLVLHYFDNLPTAAVVTRAQRLRRYLARRIARGEILKTDEIVLVGHSTGGLDIRRLIWDLHRHENRFTYADTGFRIGAQVIRNCVRGVVFLSVPHWGTNIADWVYGHSLLRKTVIADLRVAFAGSRLHLLERIEARITGGAATLTGAELLLAVRDALNESNDGLAAADPSRVADAQEAASELDLYLRHMATDFRVINDLTSRPHGESGSPAHFSLADRQVERDLWAQPPAIRVLSYATVGGRPFTFSTRPGYRVPVFGWANPCGWSEVAVGQGPSAGTDISYRLCYRLCAGGPLERPKLTGAVTRVLGVSPPLPLRIWDNDGIVNTLSMLWPGENTLVQADHLDIVGHYRLRPAPSASMDGSRTYVSYDALKSAPLLAGKIFEDVWNEIFCF
jgi:triacylglycerol lipase